MYTCQAPYLIMGYHKEARLVLESGRAKDHLAKRIIQNTASLGTLVSQMGKMHPHGGCVAAQK